MIKNWFGKKSPINSPRENEAEEENKNFES